MCEEKEITLKKELKLKHVVPKCHEIREIINNTTINWKIIWKNQKILSCKQDYLMFTLYYLY